MAKAIDLIDDAISQLTGDNAEALKEKLREAKTQLRKMEESLSDTTRESVLRKEEIRTLKETLQAKESEIEKFSKLNPELDELRQVKVKYDTMLKSQVDGMQAKWLEKAKLFKLDETDKRKPAMDKIKDKFTFGDEKTPLTQEQLAKNLELLDIYESANYFEHVETPTDPAPRPAINGTVSTTGLSSGAAALKQMQQARPK